MLIMKATLRCLIVLTWHCFIFLRNKELSLASRFSGRHKLEFMSLSSLCSSVCFSGWLQKSMKKMFICIPVPQCILPYFPSVIQCTVSICIAIYSHFSLVSSLYTVQISFVPFWTKIPNLLNTSVEKCKKIRMTRCKTSCCIYIHRIIVQLHITWWKT